MIDLVKTCLLDTNIHISPIDEKRRCHGHQHLTRGKQICKAIIKLSNYLMPLNPEKAAG